MSEGIGSRSIRVKAGRGLMNLKAMRVGEDLLNTKVAAGTRTPSDTSEGGTLVWTKHIFTQGSACIPILPIRIELRQVILIIARSWIIVITANGAAGAIHFWRFASTHITALTVGGQPMHWYRTAK